MKKVVFAFLTGIILIFHTFGQSNQSSAFLKLEQQISTTSTLKDIEKAISEAKKVAQNNEKSANGNRMMVADSLIDFAVFRKRVFQILDDNNWKSRLSSQDRTEIHLQYHANAKAMRELLEDAIKIYETELRKESVRLAAAKYELAWFTYNYVPLTFGPTSWKERLERINKSQNLFFDALNLQTKLLGEDNDEVLLTTFFLANSYSKSADFEKALPLYEKYVSGIAKKYGAKSKALIPALEMRGAILRMFGRETEAAETDKQLAEIDAGRDNSAVLLNLTPRAKSFKYDGINEKAGRVVLETNYKIPRSSNNAPNFPVAGTDAQGGSFFTAGFPVIISVDETGKVIEAEAQTDNQKLKSKIEKNVRTWEFNPFVYEEKARRIKGVIYYYN